MKKYLLFLGIISVVILAGCQSNIAGKATGYCNDTDGGRSYLVKGTAFYGGNYQTDYCMNTNQLIEFFCNSAGSRNTELMGCPLGCTKGACLGCTDNDATPQYPKGGNAYQFGTVCMPGRSCQSDACVNDCLLNEMYCGGSAGSPQMYTLPLTPPFGYKCSGGIFVTDSMPKYPIKVVAYKYTSGAVQQPVGGALAGATIFIDDVAQATRTSSSGAVTIEVPKCAKTWQVSLNGYWTYPNPNPAGLIGYQGSQTTTYTAQMFPKT